MAVYRLQRDWNAPDGSALYWARDYGHTRSALADMTGPISSFAVVAKPGDVFVVQVPVQAKKK
jgi:hypothetical protein